VDNWANNNGPHKIGLGWWWCTQGGRSAMVAGQWTEIYFLWCLDQLRVAIHASTCKLRLIADKWQPFSGCAIEGATYLNLQAKTGQLISVDCMTPLWPQNNTRSVQNYRLLWYFYVHIYTLYPGA
jgi:hypothetical protein